MAAKVGIVAMAFASVMQAGSPAHARPAAGPPRATSSRPGIVAAEPTPGTPHFPATTATVEQVRQLAQCGRTMYAVGSFSVVEQGGRTYTRHNAFSFAASAPFTMTSWDPVVNGTVNSIAFSRGQCADAYLGGDFTSIDGTQAGYLAEVSTAGSGPLVPAFGHAANARVETLAAYQGHLLAGGFFTTVNGSSANPYLASLNAKTGADDGFVTARIGGNVEFPGVSVNETKVYNQQISHNEKYDLVEGDFTSVGGQRRSQIFMLDLAARPTAQLTRWTSPRFDGSMGYPPDGYYYICTMHEPFYVRAAAWSPDDETIYLATTGYRPWNHTGRQAAGLCDAASAFTASPTGARLKWINYTGCDSLYSVAAGPGATYFAGHERWSQNPVGCDSPGTGAVPAPGLEGLVPTSGRLLLSPSGSSGLYSRGRGLGADDMLLTTAGLWIASDNFKGTQTCGSMAGLSGICFLPYPH